MASEAFPFRLWQLLWYLCIFLVGGTGNALVVIVILKSNRINGTAPFNVLIFTLAIVDFLSAVIGVPSYILSTSYKPDMDSIHKDLFCRVIGGYFIPFWLCLLSVFLLTLIILERRKAVLNPFYTLEQGNFVPTLLKVLLVSAASLVLQLPTSFGIYYTNTSPSVGNSCAYRYKRSQVIAIYSVIFFVQYLIPVSVFMVSFVQIRSQLLAGSRALVSLMARDENDNVHERLLSRLLKTKKRTIQTIKLLTLALFVCLTPNEILYALFQFFDVKNVSWNTNTYQVGVLLKFSNSCVNPILYSFYSIQFRKNFRDAFLSLFGRSHGIMMAPILSATGSA